MPEQDSTPKTLFTHKTRLHVNNKQSNFLRGCAGFRRVAYNWALGYIQTEWEENETRISPAKADKGFNAIKKDQFPWAYEYPSCVGQQSISDLKKAFDGFFRRVKRGETPGFPKFKNRKSNVSFRLTNVVLRDNHIYENRIMLPKGFGWCRIGSISRHKGRIMSTTISHRGGKWYASFLYELSYQPEHESAPGDCAVGVDLGVAQRVTVSDGSHVPLPSKIATLTHKKKRLQKILSRKANPGKGKKASTRWKTLQFKIAKVDIKIAELRKDSAHQLTASLSRENALIVLEDLNTKGMTKSAKGTKESPGKNVKAKSGLSREILNQGWYEIRRQLEYKTLRHKGLLLTIDPRYTSQMCSECGHIDKENRKTQNKFKCLKCSFEDNADVNAAKNILHKGVLELSSETEAA